MDPPRKPAARRERERVKLEIGIAEAAPAKRGANSIHKKNSADEAKSQKQEDARIIVAARLREETGGDRKNHEIAKNADDPSCCFTLFAKALRFAVGPIRAPQPRRIGMCFFDRSLLLQAAITRHRQEQEARADS